ncbi:MAG: 6,7-dimethyl-8-ribityllumazine synthase [Gammaproteobacteria bacterium]
MHEIRLIEGAPVVELPVKLAMVASRFNGLIVEPMVTACVDTLQRCRVAENDLTLVRVPGARELPLAVKRLAAANRYDAIIALGAVVRGATPHFEYVAGACSQALAALAIDHDLPIIFGIVTADSMEQALERAGGKLGNRGADAALSALEMVSLMRKLK